MGTIIYPYNYEPTFDDNYSHDIQTALDNISSIPEPERDPIPEGNYVDKNTYVYSVNEAEPYLNYTLSTPYLPEGTELDKIKISSDKRKATIYYSNGLEVSHHPMGINFNNTHYKLNPEREEGKVFYDFRGTFAEGYEIDEPNRPHYSAITIHRDDRIYVRATMDTGLDELLKMVEPMDLNVPHVPYTPTLDYVMGAPEPEPIPEPEPEQFKPHPGLGMLNQAETEPAFDYEIESDGVTYGSQYQIVDGIVDDITYDKHSNSLIVSLSESDKGFLQILIQMGLLHSIDQSPFTYFVLVDGDETFFEQLSQFF